MAAWLSSKLKVAEQLLHQIDQQAAESLRKPEKLTSHPSSLQHHLEKEREQHARASWTGAAADPPQTASKQQRPLAGLRKAPNLQTRPEVTTTGVRQDQDWTQLLSSPASSPGASTPYASSVGSCDPGSSRDVLRKSGPTPSSKTTQVSSLKQIAAQSSRLRQPSGARRNGSEAYAVPKHFRDESVKRRLDLEGSGVPDGEQALQAAVPDDAFSGTGGEGLTWGAPNGGGNLTPRLNALQSPSLVQEGNEAAEGEKIGAEHSKGGAVQNVEAVALEHVDRTLAETARNGRAGVEDVLDAALRRSTEGFSMHQVRHIPNEDTAVDMNAFVDLELETTVPKVYQDVSRQLSPPIVETVADLQTDDKVGEEESRVEGAQAPEEGGGHEDVVSDAESISGSESDSGSETSDSEYEDEVRRKAAAKRKLRKQRELEALAIEAAKAAIREREDFVRKLEIEKEILERAVADGVEQQVKEASELQLSMMEVAQAVELEKQQHSITRMEGLAQGAQLEAENADLTRALAAAQRDLDGHLSRVSELSSRVDTERDACADLERKLASLHHRQRQKTPLQQVELASPDETERSYRELQVELACKIQQRQSEVKELESMISSTMETAKRSTELELELQGRLNQLTDQLIQKQAQVEALATEKATLVFRLEALTNNLREEKSAAMLRANKRNSKSVLVDSDYDDLEFGSVRPYVSKDKAWSHEYEGVRNRIPWMNIFRQVDILFLGGARILRRHGAVRAVAGTYLLALHGWFLFVLFMKSHRDDLSLPLPAQ